MQTSYPIFENGQVLTSRHLNDVVDYLEQQDRLTRHKLIGIGIVCGLEVSYEPDQGRIRLSAGCALTSDGYLLVQDDAVLTQARPYTLPVPQVEEAPEDLDLRAPYPFFLDANGAQVPLWELLPADHTPEPGEPQPAPTDAGFIANKVALLFLERRLESLKNCEAGDCADKGMEVRLVPRILAANRADAEAMLAREAGIAGRPVDRSRHPGYDLAELRLEKIGPAALQIATFEALAARILAVTGNLGPQVIDAFKKSYDAYKYLLADIYPEAQFPNGPFGDPNYFANLTQQVGRNIYLILYFYGYMLDLVDSYNEFLAAAIRIEAECCPNPERFPLHVLLGEIQPQPVAFAAAPNLPGPVDPLAANSGLGPPTRPTPFRHHFIPSPLFDRQHEKLQALRSLHYRTYLLAYRFKLDDLLKLDIRITPSKAIDTTLSEQAIPFYYALLVDKAKDDLARNWSFDKTVRNRLDRLFSYQYTAAADHPLRYRLDDHDFYRIEGCAGKGLGQVMAALREQKRELGLSFAVEPVFLGLATGNDVESVVLDKDAQARAMQALVKLLVCRMRDLDVLFLILMAAMFQYVLTIIARLAAANTSRLGGLAIATQPSRSTRVGREGGLTGDLLGVGISPKRAQLFRRSSETLLRQLRPQRYEKGVITAKAVTSDDAKASVGKLYMDIKDPDSSANLFDRTLEFVKGLGQAANIEVVTQRIYPAVSLLDKSEALVEVLRAPSLAGFDFAEFESRYDGFVQAYEAYLDRPKSDQPEEAEIVELDKTLGVAYSSIVSTGPQSVIRGLTGEMRERLLNIFRELTLGGYVQRHPGVEHKGGVPAGGTFVVLYTHRSFLTRVVTANKAVYNERVTKMRAKYVGRADRAEIADPEQLLAAAPASEDPLDDFVVLGDFFLPYLCCDTDCSDIDLAGGKRPSITPVGVTGQVLAEAGDNNPPGLVADAAVTVIDLNTNQPVPVEVKRGRYAFTAPPGTYRIEVKGPRTLLPAERIVTLTAGAAREEDFVLRRRG